MTPNLCDAEFDKAEAAFIKAQDRVANAVMACLLQTATDLRRACGLFKITDVRNLSSGITEGLKIGDLPVGLLKCREVILNYMSTVDREAFVEKDLTMKDTLSIAADILAMAILEWNDGDYQSSYHDTVRARQNTDKLREVLRYLR
jgi:hypothetical protein